MQSFLISPDKNYIIPPLIDAERIPGINDSDCDDEFLDAEFAARANVSESAIAYILELFSPSFEKNEVSIDLDRPGILTVNASKRETEDSNCYRRREFMVKNFSRSFILPDDILLKEICAGYRNGIVTVIIPRKAIMNTFVTIISE